MSDILLKGENRESMVLRSKSFDQEKLLQDALEDNPSLLSLEDHIDGVEMATVGREVSVASGSADLLYLDNQGILNLVEVKLDSNREVRRNVVGQILEYASQMINWDYLEVEERFSTYNSQKRDSLFRYLNSEIDGLDMEEKEFKDLVEEQLQDGQIRLVIAVNNMVDPLRDIITFLNNYTTFEIYALQIDQYKAEDLNVYVPRLFGYKSESSGGSSKRKRWNKSSFFEDVKKKLPEQTGKMRKLFKIVDPDNTDADSDIRADEVSRWGSGSKRGSFNPIYHPIGGKSLFSVYSDGEMEIHMKWNKESREEVEQFVKDLQERNEAVNKNIAVRESSAYFHISHLSDNFGEFSEAVKETIEKCRE